MRTPARILIVDDNPTNVDILSARLESEGYEIVTAGDGEQALEAARAQLPDLILLDVMMPGMDGPTTLQQLRTLPHMATVPVVFMTAKVMPDEIEHYKTLGALDVIRKPFNPMTLAATLNTIWEKCGV
ncbi:MAG: PleD family two-component system response regulator [Rhodothermales bacterium]